jgi:hypothetical protein
MSSLPFTDQQCFFAAMLVFIVVGFQRGWRRELISLVFVLLGVFLVNPNNARNVGAFLARIPSTIGLLITGSQSTGSQVSQPVESFFGPWGPLLFFAIIMAIGYIVGNRAFPKPATPVERFIGIIPAVVTGAFVLSYLSSFFARDATGRSIFTVAVQPPDPGNFVPIILVIVILALIIALVASRTKKPAKK